MRILILGGDGYLGWPTALHLSDRGHDVASHVHGRSSRLADHRRSERDKHVCALAQGNGRGGSVPLRVPPAPATLAAMPYHAFHPFGVEMRRANVIRGVAGEAAGGRLERLADLPPSEARRRLRAVSLSETHNCR